jgi:hypothetical protein
MSGAVIAGATGRSTAPRKPLAACPVFNLTVAKTPEFFAAGVLVHNCDAASCGMLMLDTLMKARPAEGPKPEAAPEWSMAWMKERIARSSGDTNAHVPRMLNGRERKTKAVPKWTS